MSTLIAALALALAPGARAEEPQRVYDVDCVESQVTLSFAIIEDGREDRPLFRDRTELDTACTGGIAPDQLELLGLVLDDLCQVAGVSVAECDGVVASTLGRLEDVATFPPLRKIGISPVERTGDGLLAELSLGFQGGSSRTLLSPFDGEGTFTAREAAAVADPPEDALLRCVASGDLGARGQVSRTEALARIELDHNRQFLCSTTVEGFSLDVRIGSRQRAGTVGGEPAVAQD